MRTAIEAHLNANETTQQRYRLSKLFNIWPIFPNPERNMFEQCQKSKNFVYGDEWVHTREQYIKEENVDH